MPKDFARCQPEKIGHANVADLTGAYQIVEGMQHLFDGSQRIEAMQLEQVDVVGT
jgi:hypothetical protein